MLLGWKWLILGLRGRVRRTDSGSLRIIDGWVRDIGKSVLRRRWGGMRLL